MKTLNADYITHQGVSIFKRSREGSVPYVSALSRQTEWKPQTPPEGVKAAFSMAHPGCEETLELAKQVVDQAIDGRGKPVVKHAIMRRYLGSPFNPVELVWFPGSEEVYSSNGHNHHTDPLATVAELNVFYASTPENLEKVRVLHFSTEPDQIMALAAQMESEMESSRIDVIAFLAE